jgi:hypothetical protein
VNKLTRRNKVSLSLLIGTLILVTTTASACPSEVPENLSQNDPVANSNFEAQKKNDPIPNLTDSLERANIIEHQKRNNQPDRIRYVYLLTDYGQVVSYHVIKGKLTAAGAQLTPTDQVVDVCSKDAEYCPEVVQGQTDDGSYGGDEGGVYFFDDKGVEVQWNGKWHVSDAPMKIKEGALILTAAK